jgi:hypothetical protein
MQSVSLQDTMLKNVSNSNQKHRENIDSSPELIRQRHPRESVKNSHIPNELTVNQKHLELEKSLRVVTDIIDDDNNLNVQINITTILCIAIVLCYVINFIFCCALCFQLEDC